ncbi:MAG TPA: hypothetical protein VHV51_15535 [Polyangiaceae bacterium]|nr:hypothetical protein [Polyangiaceae bacterium]
MIEGRARASIVRRHAPRWIILVCSLMALALPACPANLQDPERFDDAGTPDPNQAPACLTDAFNKTCASQVCHSPGSTSNDLDLISPGLASRIVNVPATYAGLDAATMAMCPPTKLNYIDTANPSNSWIQLKLSNMQNGCGLQMPETGNWTTADKTCLANWIQQLAANNVDAGTGGSATGGSGGSSSAMAGSAGTASSGTSGSGGSSAGGMSGAGGTAGAGGSAGGAGMSAGGTSGAGGASGSAGTGGM